MRFLKLFFLFLFLNTSLFCQHSLFPKGGYKTFDELKMRKPSLDFDFVIRKRDTIEIKESRGNDYDVTSNNQLLTKKFIKKEIYAISNGDSLFINCNKHGLQKGYSYAFIVGDYIVFNTALPEEEINEMAKKNSVAFGMIGGAIGGALIVLAVTETKSYEYALLRFPFVLDTSNGAVFYLERYRLLDFLNRKPSLKEQYKKEKDIDSPIVILDYLRQLNQSFSEQTR